MKLQEHDQVIREMIANGHGYTTIASKIGARVEAVWRYCKKIGIKSGNEPSKRKSIDIDQIISRYESGISLFKLVKEVGLSGNTIKARIKDKYPDYKFRTMDDVKRPPELNDKSKFIELANKFSFTKIAKLLKVRPATVCAAGKKFDIKSKWDFVDVDIAPQVLHELYIEKSLKISEICKELGKKYGFILRQLKKHGFAIDHWGGKKRPSRHLQLNDRAWLEDQYIKNGLSMADIADIVGTSIGNIAHHIRKHKIAIRPRSAYLTRLLSHGKKIKVGNLELDSKMERDFIKNLPPDTKIERAIELESQGSWCFVDFRINDELVEVKPLERSITPGVERRQLVKQYMVAKRNGEHLRVWNGSEFVVEIVDADIYYAHNWKLFFENPGQCSDWLINYRFRGVEYSMHELLDGVKKALMVHPDKMLDANFQNEDVLKLIRHHSPHYWFSAHKDYLPVSAAWAKGNHNILRDAVSHIWEKKRETNLYGLIRAISKNYKDFNMVSIFKPWVARYIYDRYLPNGGTIIDPCIGWGGRLIACIDSNFSYIGYDLNIESVCAANRIFGAIKNKLNGTVKIEHGDSSIITFDHGDLLMTSPPYDDTEYYHGLKQQCTNSDPIYHNILGSFKGIIALNIPKYHVDRCMQIAKQHGRELIETLQMRTAALIRRESTFEPILVFDKI